jgi:hypothetical protein
MTEALAGRAVADLPGNYGTIDDPILAGGPGFFDDGQQGLIPPGARTPAEPFGGFFRRLFGG